MLHFGPHVLGFLGWQQVAAKQPKNWHTLMKEVKVVFGISREQLEERFFALEKRRDESSAQFVKTLDQNVR